MISGQSQHIKYYKLKNKLWSTAKQDFDRLNLVEFLSNLTKQSVTENIHTPHSAQSLFWALGALVRPGVIF